MADISVYERTALYDNSRDDENHRDCYVRLPWNVVTMTPGLDGAPRSTFLEPIAVNLSSTCKTVDTAYHRVDFLDAKNSVGSAAWATGGENRVD